MATLTQLEYIVTVDRLRHFGKAAAACHVSQPSLSMQIQKVEDELGLTIFDRLKKPIVPTEKGAAFIEQAKVVLRESQKLNALAKSHEKEVSGEFRLAIIPTLAPYLLPLFVDDFSRLFPKVRLKIDESKTDNIIRDLKDDSIDGGILATPLNEAGLKEKVLFYERFSIYVGKDHPFSSRKRLREEELDGCDMWLLQDGHCLRNQVVRLCSIKSEQGVYRNIQFEGGNLETLRYLVRKGRGYTLIPQLFVNTLPESERRDYVKEFEAPSPSREVSLVYRREQWKSDILNAIESTLLKNLPKDIRLELDKSRTAIIKI